MAENTKIEWTDHTINFWWGCEKVSPACANCYAEREDARWHIRTHAQTGDWDGFSQGVHGRGKHWGPGAPRLLRVAAASGEALRYERRAVALGRRFKVFTNSMSDFFEDRRDLDAARLEALDTIRLTPHLDWLILTKRPMTLMKLLHRAKIDLEIGRFDPSATCLEDSPLHRWLTSWTTGKAPANVWLGTTVEDQKRAELRIPALLRVPAAVRFLSCEPILGPVDLPHWINLPRPVAGDWPIGHTTIAEAGLHKVARNPHGARSVIAANGRELGIKPDECKDLALGVDWVICGGESGPKARPMHPDWARSLRDQCAAEQVPFFFKQWGSGIEFSQAESTGVFPVGVRVRMLGKKAAGRLLDGVEHNAMPEVL